MEGGKSNNCDSFLLHFYVVVIHCIEEHWEQLVRTVTHTLSNERLADSDKLEEIESTVEETIIKMGEDENKCMKVLDTVHDNIRYLYGHRLILPIPPSRFEMAD